MAFASTVRCVGSFCREVSRSHFLGAFRYALDVVRQRQHRAALTVLLDRANDNAKSIGIALVFGLIRLTVVWIQASYRNRAVSMRLGPSGFPFSVRLIYREFTVRPEHL